MTYIEMPVSYRDSDVIDCCLPAGNNQSTLHS